MRKLLYLVLVCLVGVGMATSTQALTVSPARVEITGDPGTVLHSEIELFNEQEETRTFFISFENFEPSGDSGAPHFIGAQDGLATWLQSQSEVNLESGTRAIVPFSITIPQTAEPGGYFATVFFGSQPPKGTAGGEVTIGGKIGVLILLRVSGEIAEGGGLLDFKAKDDQNFFSVLPVTFEYRLNNSGDDRVVPLGEIKIKNTFRLTSVTLLANENKGSALPGSTRKFSVVWGKESVQANTERAKPGFFEVTKRQWQDFKFGWYTARLDIAWGETNQTARAVYNFFIIPWQLLLIMFAIASAVWIIGRQILRKYNRLIIARAMRSQSNNE